MVSREWRSGEDSSRTADMTCLSRAISYCDERPSYKSGDYIAPQIVPIWVNLLLRLRLLRRFFVDRLIPYGMYEYVIARTRYFDNLVERCLTSGFDQIVILGAGFDSRSLRFAPLSGKARIFEIDAPATQAAKLKQYRIRKIKVPGSAVFVAMDFEKQSLKDTLIDAGFAPSLRSLFLMEGLTMYLEAEAVDATLAAITDLSSKDSEFAFDFVRASVINGKGLYRGEREVLERMARAGERWIFGLEMDTVATFLAERGFNVVELLDSLALEKRFFESFSADPINMMSETHCIVRASL
jgi:methyltransferase (TIGR00027 family)